MSFDVEARRAMREQDERIAELEQQLAELKCDMVKRERYHKAQLAELRAAVQTLRKRVRQRNGGLIVVGAEEYDALAALLKRRSSE